MDKEIGSVKRYWKLSDRQLCDFELIMNGGFSPLKNFLNKKDYYSVLNNMRLDNGDLWPVPINLDVDKKFKDDLKLGEKIGLRDKEGFVVGKLIVEDIWKPDLIMESQLVYGTKDQKHPGVNYLLNISNPYYISGSIQFISLPIHYDFKSDRHTPKELKSIFKTKGWEKIVAFQTRNPLHKAHIEMTKSAMSKNNTSLLIHPAVGMTQPGDVNHYTRVRCYKHALKHYPENTSFLSLLPLAMRMGGPREAVLHAIIRKNYGCTHLIVGRDHAGPGSDSNNMPFYGEYDAQEKLSKYKNEIGIKIIPFDFMVYLPQKNRYESIKNISNATKYETLSGTQLRALLDKGEDIPEWFTYKEVANELKKSKPKLHKRGFTVFFTGLSGSGKSTLANGLLAKFLEEGSRNVTLLDGDIVRTHLSSELGFSKNHRSLNVQRIGFVASEITKNNGIAICAPIAPYETDRTYNKKLISSIGGYFEVYINTPLEKCEERDSKGLYKLAREGVIKEFTGISDPYEIPVCPDIIIDSSSEDPSLLVEKIYLKIKNSGYLKNED